MIRTRLEIAQTLDLACLKPPVTLNMVDKAIATAIIESCASVCVPSIFAQEVVHQLKNTSVHSCVVTGFPHGNSLGKLDEVQQVVDFGVREVDFVIDYGLFLSGNIPSVAKEINHIVQTCEDSSAHCKAILEICYLTPDQIRELSKICVREGVDYLKTSTGFGPGGATPEAVKIMLEECKDTYCKVKASSGIKTASIANMYLDMGCHRLGVGSLDCLPLGAG
jgi:deoxyribose-phosphate aldolase